MSYSSRNMQQYNQVSELDFDLEGYNPSTGSFEGASASQRFQGLSQWQMASSMAASSLPLSYESGKMAPHVQAFAQNQTILQTPFFPHVPVAQPKSLLTQQLAVHAVHPNFGYSVPQEMTINPAALSPSSTSPMSMNPFSPHSEHMDMDDFPNFSPTTPAEATWSTLSTQPIPILSARQRSHEGVGSVGSSYSGQYYSPSPHLPNFELSMSPMAEMSYLGAPSSYQGTSDMGGFTEAQVQAARNIQRFQLVHPGNAIPTALITSELAEIVEGKGWCLIGSCGLERENNKMNPTYNVATDKARKRLDHLYDHIRDKHFGCRPHQCLVCFSTFAREHDLKRHEKTHQQVSLSCGHCPKVYTRKDNLQRHVDTKHPGSAPAK